MSEKKTKRVNPYLTQYETADKNLTSILNEIKMLTGNKPKERMSEQTYKNKVYNMRLKWNKLLGKQDENAKDPKFDLEYLVKDLESKKVEAEKALGSFYKLKRGSNFANFIGQTGLGITGGGGGVNFATKTPGYVNLPLFSSEGGLNYEKNEDYIDKFNPKGEAAFNINKNKPATDKWGRDYDNPNYGINPNRLILSTKGNDTKVDKSKLTISDGQ